MFLSLRDRSDSVMAGLSLGRGKDEGRGKSPLMKEAGLSPLPHTVSLSSPQGSENQANRS